MTGWMLDTNILSAFAPGKPTIEPSLAGWFDERSDQLFLSAITAAEIEAGIPAIPSSSIVTTGSGQRICCNRVSTTRSSGSTRHAVSIRD